MPIKIKVVPDSNIFIAAALNRGYCYDWLFGASEPLATYDLYTSEEILRGVSGWLAGSGLTVLPCRNFSPTSTEC